MDWLAAIPTRQLAEPERSSAALRYLSGGVEGAGVVFDDDVHGVFDVGGVGPDAAVAEVAVVLLVVEVEGFEVGIGGEVEEEVAVVAFGAGEAALVRAGEAEALGHGWSVELAFAGGEGFGGDGAEP